MKIMTILGTRPEIIRLSRIIPLLDKNCKHTLVDTGQNHDPNLSTIFYRDLNLRSPDYQLDCRAETPMSLVGRILAQTEDVLRKEKPDRLLLLGDTNSALSAICAKRMGVKVYHMEAGNRCYDDRVPEELNRRLVDHSSDFLLPYTQQSKENLLREGIHSSRVYVTGNPILEVIEFYKEKIEASDILKRLGIQSRKYFLVTLHRAENVDIPERLENFLTSLINLAKDYQAPVICSLHPRTRSHLQKPPEAYKDFGIYMCEPFGFFDFVQLELNSLCVLSDSGTVQEECSIFKIPNVTLRDVTERPETLECGSNILSGVDNISSAVRIALSDSQTWMPPKDYTKINVSQTVLRIILGYTRS